MVNLTVAESGEGAVSGCEPSDDVRRIIRAMARAKVEEGITDAGAIVDEIHAAIQDHTPLWKNEIADIITGIGQPKRQATKSELQQRMEQLRRDLKDAYHPKVAPTPKSPEAAANERRQAAIKKQMAEIQEKIRTGNFTKTAPTVHPDDPATQKARLELAAAKREADKLLAKIQRENRTPTQKVVDTMAELYRASILSGYTVFEHLAGASIGRFLTAPLEELSGALLHQVPGIKAISNAAPTEGGGFNGQGLAHGYKKAFSPETGKAVLDKIVRGYSDRQALYDKHVDYDNGRLAFVGHLHDAVKTPVEQFAFYKALDNVNKQQRNQMARDGFSPDQIDDALKNEYNRTRNETLAYASSKAAKLQGKNWVVDIIQGGIRGMEKYGALGKVGAGVAKMAMPIIRIPTNYAKEAGEYVAGVPHGLFEAMWHGRERLKPDVADDIMRKLKKGLIGPALITLGWVLYKDLGALYDEKRRKRVGEPDYGSVRTPAGDISHHMLHIPAVEVIQMAALAHRVYDQQFGKLDKKTGERTGRADAIMDAAWRATTAEGRTLPFVPTNLSDAMGSSKGLANYTGRMAAGFVPQIVQQIARGTDPDKAPRKPNGFVEQIEAGIPGLRESVGHRPLKGMSLDDKLELYDKMSPRERQKSGIADSIMQSARAKRSDLTQDQMKRIQAIHQ
jgi:hypothetical protein